MSDPFEGWAIVELMGHRRLAGHVSEAEQFGTAMLRLDVYIADGDKAVVSQFYGGSAVYCITPTTENIARKMGARSSPAPVSRYELEPPKPHLAAVEDDDPWDDDDPGDEDMAHPF